MEDYFLIALIILSLIAIFYFNIRALINYDKSFELNIVDSRVECKYKNLKVANICPNTEEEFCFSPSVNNYLLGLIPKSYIQVCGDICQPIDGAKTCDDPSLDKRYLQCIKDLEPPENCTDPEKAIALDSEGNYLYARQLFFGNG